MIIYPAIDLRGGQCVRLTQGCFDRETVFSDQPAAIAQQWAQAGAEYLHVVDLDGAVAKRLVNTKAITDIINAVNIPVQLGGGIRSLAAIEQALSLGVERVILGSVAVVDPALVAEACRLFPGKIVVGLDAKDGRVAIEGWAVQSDIAVETLAQQMAAVGVGRLIFTDISLDGTLQGVNVAATLSVAMAAGIPVIASGGVKAEGDIAALLAAGRAIDGVIIGKALYTGAIDLASVIKLAKQGGDDHAYETNNTLPRC